MRRPLPSSRTHVKCCGALSSVVDSRTRPARSSPESQRALDSSAHSCSTSPCWLSRKMPGPSGLASSAKAEPLATAAASSGAVVATARSCAGPATMRTRVASSKLGSPALDAANVVNLHVRPKQLSRRRDPSGQPRSKETAPSLNRGVGDVEQACCPAGVDDRNRQRRIRRACRVRPC